MAIEGVENGDREGGVAEGDGFITEIADARGAVGGVEVCGCAGESGDCACIDGSRGVAIEGVENGDREGGVAEGDGFVAETCDIA